MARASGRAFMALGQALGDLFQRQELQRLREAEREEARAERDLARRANLLTRPGAYESPDTRLSVRPPALETPDLPSFPTSLRGREGPGGLETSARKVLAPPDRDVPELPTVRQERTPLPEGHTRPLPGIAYNPRFEAEQEEARNRALAEAAIAAGSDPELAGLLEYTGPAGLGAVLPAPDEPPTYQFRETSKGIEGFNPRDPTDVVATGRVPPPSATSTTAGAREARIAAADRRRQLESEVGERALAMAEALRNAGQEMSVGQLTGALMASFPAEAKPPRAIAEGAAARAITGSREQSLINQRREQQIAGDEGTALAEYLTGDEDTEEAPEEPAAPAMPPATRQPARQEAPAAAAEEEPEVPDDPVQQQIMKWVDEGLTDEQIMERARERGLIVGGSN